MKSLWGQVLSKWRMLLFPWWLSLSKEGRVDRGKLQKLSQGSWVLGSASYSFWYFKGNLSNMQDH